MKAITRSVAGTLLAFALPAYAVPSAYFPEWVRTSVASVYGIRKVVNGDFTGDGRPDLAARTTYQTIYILPTQSDGTIGTASLVYTGSYLSDMVAADVNGDGRVDLIFADTGTNTLVALLSNGDGTFAPPIQTAITFAPTEIVAGDFNGDGKVDVAIRSYSATVLAVYIGDGTGHFSEASRADLAAEPYHMAVGDVDGDGKLDVLVAASNPFRFVLYYGKGDGTFEAPVAITSPSAQSTQIVLADLDGDGRAEVISCEFYANTVTVLMSLGGRTFATPATYHVVPADLNPNGYGNPIDLVVGDVTGDGKPDIVVTLANIRSIGTLAGNGDGTLRAAEYSHVPQDDDYNSTFPDYLSLADFDGDGQLDIAVVSPYVDEVILFRNANGGVKVSVGGNYPIVSAGQPVTFSVTVTPADGLQSLYGHPPPFPIGTVTLKNGTAVIGTGTLQSVMATISVDSLPIGANSITASFDGDLSYRASVSAAVVENVVADATTVTLTSSSGPEILYGQQWSLQATATSPISGSLTGSFWLFTDGQRSNYTVSGPPTYWSQSGYVTVGTHSYYTAYEGNPTHPPGKSNVVTVVVRKAPSTALIGSAYPDVRYGQQTIVSMNVGRTGFGADATGDLRLYEGSALLGTMSTTNGQRADMPLLALPIGTHVFRCEYGGDQNYEPSQSPPLKITVIPASGFVLDVIAGSNTITASGTYVPSFGGHYEINRRIGSGGWTKADAYAFSPTYSQLNPLPGTVYVFRIDAVDSNNHLIESSNTDLAMIVSFTDDPIQPSTTVKAQHIQELVTATNVLRAAAGLQPISLPDAAAGQFIQASHILALRAAINEARAALGASPAPFTTDVASGSSIRIQDVQDLREAMR